MLNSSLNDKHISRQKKIIPNVRYSPGLPILEKKVEILENLLSKQIIIISGETGSGKTTQLPVICLEAGRGKDRKIGCTQPRRIAASSIARRVCEELHCTLGKEIGFKVRFNDKDSPETCIKFMTDGILLSEIEHDPFLEQYDTLIIDEAHERSLNIDFILGYLRKILDKRKDLKVIISSATIDTELFSRAFDNAPVIEVSGRLYPVELLYLTEDREPQDENESYVDSAVTAAKELIEIYGSGDMLIFMPTERDIRETSNRIKGLKLYETEVVPLFSRLSMAEQELVFKKLDKRKIVVATNIAETSITVPGIRFVVDTGLARISSYTPRLRTNRLPIVPISKAAADQRKGRCGRVREGVCIRLYTEKDYLSRDQFSLPEIRRADLAGVILTMTAHRLGPIEEFPFLEPPSTQAVSDGYSILKELGAIDNNRDLTSTGKEMSRLPLDPCISRMILQARHENSLREVKIIAAALSIVDPRERPLDKQTEADTMHRKFTDQRSDFLFYVNLWDAYKNEWNSLHTQGNMRRFCKEHFLSFVRMREWHDVYQFIEETLGRMKGFKENESESSYESIHKAIASGLLSNIALKDEKNRYQGTGGKELIIFPGSAAYGKGAGWIMCHEVVETSQIFARTVAEIKPDWIEILAPHLCKRTYGEPFFNVEGGYVAAHERVTFMGLPISEHRNIRFGRVNPGRAVEVFIEQALVQEQLGSTSYGFYRNNVALRKEIEDAEAKLRSRTLFAGENVIVDFYQKRLGNVSSVHDLNRLIKDKGGDRFLYLKKEDLLCKPLPEKTAEFPDQVEVGGKQFSLKYAFEPGSENDGVTLQIPVENLRLINPEISGWLVPALWPRRIGELLRNLPKDLRKKFMQINEKASELASVLAVSPDSFELCLSKAIKKLYNIEIDPRLFSKEKIAPHLAVRLEIKGKEGTTIASGRDWSILNKRSISSSGSPDKISAIYKKYEQSGLTSWSVGDLPDVIEAAGSPDGLPIYGYPALKAAQLSVDLVLCRTVQECRSTHTEGVKRLLEIICAPEFAWVEKELKFDQELKILCAPLGNVEKVNKAISESIRSFLLETGSEAPRKRNQFDGLAEGLCKKAKGIGYEALSLLRSTLLLYKENAVRIQKRSESRLSGIKNELKTDLSAYIDELTEDKLDFERFRQFPRYMKAFGFRIERAFTEPLKYKEKKSLLEKYLKKLNSFKGDSETGRQIHEFQMMIEEYAISLFAQQEVKTIFAISEKRLEKKIEEIELIVKK